MSNILLYHPKIDDPNDVDHPVGWQYEEKLKKFTFITIPKNQSTFLKESLFFNTNNNFKQNILQEITMDSYALIRNPLDRFVSALAYLAIKNQIYDMPWFLSHCSQFFGSMFEQYNKYEQIELNCHLRKQSHYIFDQNINLYRQESVGLMLDYWKTNYNVDEKLERSCYVNSTSLDVKNEIHKWIKQNNLENLILDYYAEDVSLYYEQGI